MIKNFTVAKMKMINAALKPKDQMQLKIWPKPTVEGDHSCFDTTRTVSSNGNERKDEYANIHREHKRSIEGVFTCNRRLTNQHRDIFIPPAEICKCRRKKIKLSSQYVNSSCKPSIMSKMSEMSNKSMINSPEKKMTHQLPPLLTQRPILEMSTSTVFLIG